MERLIRPSGHRLASAAAGIFCKDFLRLLETICWDFWQVFALGLIRPSGHRLERGFKHQLLLQPGFFARIFWDCWQRWDNVLDPAICIAVTADILVEPRKTEAVHWRQKGGLPAVLG